MKEPKKEIEKMNEEEIIFIDKDTLTEEEMLEDEEGYDEDEKAD